MAQQTRSNRIREERPLYGAVETLDSIDINLNSRPRLPVFTVLCLILFSFLSARRLKGSHDGISFREAGSEPPQLYIYKRTYLSGDAVEDASFMNENLGLMIDASSIFRCSPETPGFRKVKSTNNSTKGSKDEINFCSQRYSVVSDLNPELHFFQSDVTPEGPIPAGEWIKYWNDLHSNFDEGFEWHEFMAMALSAYTPDLTPFIRRWMANRIPCLRRKVYRAFDSSTLYSARIVIPNTGHIIELVSVHVDDEFIDTFVPYSGKECQAAHSLSQWTVDEMRFLWSMNGGNLPSNITAMLPDILMLQLSHPTTDITAFKQYLANATGGDIDIDVYTDSNSNCSWADVSMEPILWMQTAEQQSSSADVSEKGFREVPHFGKLSGPGGVKSRGVMSTKNTADNEFRIYIRMIHNPAADVGAYSVNDYSNYISQTIDTFTGSNKGYSRHLDSHIGLDISYETSLDTVADNLDQMQVSFHSAGDMITGSNWARGVNGLNVEFLGYYDNMKFTKSEITELDYCSHTGFSISHKSEDATYCAGNWDSENLNVSHQF